MQQSVVCSQDRTGHCFFFLSCQQVLHQRQDLLEAGSPGFNGIPVLGEGFGLFLSSVILIPHLVVWVIRQLVESQQQTEIGIFLLSGAHVLGRTSFKFTSFCQSVNLYPLTSISLRTFTTSSTADSVLPMGISLFMQSSSTNLCLRMRKLKRLKSKVWS